MSFWEGVDVPGDALRLVIINKLPFAVPTDPVVAARCRALEEAGHDQFLAYSVPEAAITLKQGFGGCCGRGRAGDRRHPRPEGADPGLRADAALRAAAREEDQQLEEVRAFWAAVKGRGAAVFKEGCGRR